MTLVINLFGGPGVGKSTLATRVFSMIKALPKIKVEYVPEVAKEIIWYGNIKSLQCAPFVSFSQLHKIELLINEVDIIVTDSPILLGAIYSKEYEYPEYELLSEFIIKTFSRFNNLNYFITRKKNYNKYGRTQTEDEAKSLDSKILDLLEVNKVPFMTMSYNAVEAEIHTAALHITKTAVQYIHK